VSAFVKSPGRWNVALSRAKEGLATFGNFSSLQGAIEAHHDPKMHVIADLIKEIHDRDIMIVDWRPDLNPLLSRGTSPEVLAAYQQLTHEIASKDWFANVRDDKVKSRQYPVVEKAGRLTSTFVGKGSSGPFGYFPQHLRPSIEARANADGASLSRNEPSVENYMKSAPSSRKQKKNAKKALKKQEKADKAKNLEDRRRDLFLQN
jgi:hypothetical protein